MNQQLQSALLQLPLLILKCIIAYLDISGKSNLLQSCKLTLKKKEEWFLPIVPYEQLSKEIQLIYGISSFDSFLYPRQNGSKWLIPEAKIPLFGAKVETIYSSPYTRSLVVVFEQAGAQFYFMTPRENQFDYAKPLFTTEQKVKYATFSCTSPRERVALFCQRRIIIIQGYEKIINAETGVDYYDINFQLPNLHYPRYVDTNWIDGSTFYAPTNNGLLRFRCDIDFENCHIADIDLRTILFPSGNVPRYFLFFRGHMALITEEEIRYQGKKVMTFDSAFDMATGLHPLSDEVMQVVHDKHCIFIVGQALVGDKFVKIINMASWEQIRNIAYDSFNETSLFSCRYFYSMENGDMFRKDVFEEERKKIRLNIPPPSLLMWDDPFILALKNEKYINYYNFRNPQHAPQMRYPIRLTISNASALTVQSPSL